MIPILKLPDIVVVKILGQCQWIDLINIALCSKASCYAVSLLKNKPQRNDVTLDVLAVGYHHTIIMKVNGMLIKWRFLEQKKILCTYGADICYIENLGKRCQDDVLLFITHILVAMFGVKVGAVEINTRNVKKLTALLKSSCFLNASRHIFTAGSVNEQQLGLILDAPPVEELKMHVMTPYTYQHRAVEICARHLTISEAGWMSRETLLALDCVSFDVRHTRLDSEALGEFLKQWVESTCKKLTKAIIGTEWSIEKSRILQGCPAGAMELKEQLKALNFINDDDFLLHRPDGSTAKVIIDDCKMTLSVYPPSLINRFLSEQANNE